MAKQTRLTPKQQVWNISVQFSPQIRSDGELVRVTITQVRDEEQTILLTEAQARSLVDYIDARLPRAAAVKGLRHGKAD